jgi:large subunit ribosomal protein L35
MPKLKTHKGAAKRFKKTGTGKIVRSKAYHSHLLSKKSRKRKRNLNKKEVIDKSERKKVERMLTNR